MRVAEGAETLGVYVHIPFCVKKCRYCDFLSYPATEHEKEAYVQLLVDELAQWASFLQEQEKQYRIKTVFLGGGTPSCLSPQQLLKIGRAVKCLCGFECCEEFTMEMNPATLQKEHLVVLRRIGVNRISLGLQSAQERELQYLGRIHDWETFVSCYETLCSSGFDNINVDLMADLPGQTVASYTDTLRRVLALKPEHISAYSLIVEPNTEFARMQAAGELVLPDEDEDRKMYEITKNLLQEQGMYRYEISNYSIPGKECRHNLTYWSGGAYIGVGLGASSYLEKRRFQNPERVDDYREMIVRGTAVADTFGRAVELSRQEQMEEYLFLGLRRMKGISKSGFLHEFGVSLETVYGDVVNKLLQKKLLTERSASGRICLTERGIDLSNMVLAEFLL